MATVHERKRRAKRLSNLIHKVLSKYGITSQQLAEELKVSPKNLTHWKNGHNSPRTNEQYHSVMADLKYFLRKLEEPPLPELPKNLDVEPVQEELPFDDTPVSAPSALAIQVGGNHYKDSSIQPIEYIEANALGFLEGCMLKRLTRHDKPTGKGRQDIEKIIHEASLLLELRYGSGA